MRAIFVDSGFWIALRDPTDENHAKSARISRRLIEWRARLIVTPFVFAEVQARFSRARQRREQVIRDCWKNPIVRHEQATIEDQESAVEILLQHKDKSFSFCDAVSFAVMLRLGLGEVVSFDDHFRQFGQFQIIDE